MLNTAQLRNEFPVLTKNSKLAYLDNGASCQTPRVVLAAMNDYYENYRANIHRGQYKISEQATEEYEKAREVVAKFINAEQQEIVLTQGTTHGINLLAYSLCSTLGKGDNVVLTRMEHHANMIAWQQMSKRYGFEVRFIEIKDYLLDLQSARVLIDNKTKIVSFAHISNVLGTISPAVQLVTLAHSVGAMAIIDAAQSAAHIPIDVKKIDCDALVFSGHKIYGPTGIGILYVKRKLQEQMPPFFYGGGMITEVTYENSAWVEGPEKFEAGTPNIAGAIGLAKACQFLENLGWENIIAHETDLIEYALQKIGSLPNLTIVGSKQVLSSTGELTRAGVLSFALEGVHFHDVATILADNNICVRAGHHCAMPLMRYLGVNGTARASFGIYNTRADVDALAAGIADVQNTFSALNSKK